MIQEDNLGDVPDCDIYVGTVFSDVKRLFERSKGKGDSSLPGVMNRSIICLGLQVKRLQTNIKEKRVYRY